jgi:hypothetical protein
MSYREEELQTAIRKHVVEDYSLEDLEEYVIDDLISKYERSESNIDNIIEQMEDEKIWINAMSSGQQKEK